MCEDHPQPAEEESQAQACLAFLRDRNVTWQFFKKEWEPEEAGLMTARKRGRAYELRL